MDETHADITTREAAPSESAIILHQWRSMSRDMGDGSVEVGSQGVSDFKRFGGIAKSDVPDRNPWFFQETV